MKICGVILAGGFGRRLAPLSTLEKPKQFHDLTDSGQTLIQETVARAKSFSNSIHIIGNASHKENFAEQVPDCNLILEPSSKNTAASIFIAAQKLPNSILVIMPADHLIHGNFAADVARAVNIAKTGRIVTFGISPTDPNENYGYIVTHKFTEKPQRERAEQLIAQSAKWNSGIFVARSDVLLGEFKKHQPAFFKSSFDSLPSIPFDKAIMEKTARHVCLTANFEWDDLGNWESVARHNPNLAYKLSA